jgi:hypothetical protein
MNIASWATSSVLVSGHSHLLEEPTSLPRCHGMQAAMLSGGLPGHWVSPYRKGGCRRTRSATHLRKLDVVCPESAAGRFLSSPCGAVVKVFSRSWLIWRAQGPV